MRLLISVGTAFVYGFIAALATSFLLNLLAPHAFPFQPIVCAGIALGIAVAIGIRSQWALSKNTYTVLLMVFLTIGNVVGNWLSARP